MFLFDTDTLSNIIRRKPPTTLLNKLIKIPLVQKFTTTITVGEMFYGAYKTPNPDYFLDQLSSHVWPTMNILSFDKPSAQTYGKLRADLEKKGVTIGEPDLRIASITLINRLTLVTGNVRHFERIPGLSIENWLI